MLDPVLQIDRTVPQRKILIDGELLPDEVDLDILDVTVSDYVSGASSFCINVNIWDSDKQEFKYIDGQQFGEGVPIEVQLGYDDEQVVSLIKGEVTCLEPEFNNGEAPTLKVQGYDSLHRFRRGRKTKSYIEMKDSEIAQQIAGNLGLNAQVDDSQVVHEYLLQNNLTDIDFLSERARRIRFELVAKNGTLYFRSAANDEDKVVTLEYGLSLQSFYPRLSTMTQVSEIVVQGWDPINKQTISGAAAIGDEISQMGGSRLGAAITESAFFQTKNIIVNKPIFNEGEALQIAKGKFNEMAVAFIKGEGTAIGNPDIRAGKVIDLLGLGERFSGLYYVTSATHAINKEGYSTKFTVERNAT